nr:MAG: hypothetical protein [Molluscum contagiosum virus]WQH58180.1 MAG: hypothetical protein [Molluscum contagiosum virus]
MRKMFFVMCARHLHTLAHTGCGKMFLSCVPGTFTHSHTRDAEKCFLSCVPGTFTHSHTRDAEKMFFVMCARHLHTLAHTG